MSQNSNKQRTMDGPWFDLGYQQITALGSSVALIVPIGTLFVEICPEGQAVRYRADGTAPTASVGMPIAAGQVYPYTGTDIAALRFIEQAAGAKLNVKFYG